MERAESEGRLRPGRGRAGLAVLPLLLALVGGCPGEPQQALPSRTATELYAFGNELARGGRDLPGAIEAYGEALSLDPGMPEAHFGLGLALLQSGDAEGAAAEIESALSLAPLDATWRQDAEDALAVAYLHRAQGEPR